MVIKETIRLYPTVPVFGRKLQRDFDVGEWNVILFHYAKVIKILRKKVSGV
jgi:cytochrome P450